VAHFKESIVNPDMIGYARKLHDSHHQGYARISEMMARRGVTLTPDEWCVVLGGRPKSRVSKPSVTIVKQPAPPTYGERYRASLRAGFDPFEMLDAINECPHGRMPGYAGSACACWKVTA
jgi:hypothetical protein